MWITHPDAPARPLPVDNLEAAAGWGEVENMKPTIPGYTLTGIAGHGSQTSVLRGADHTGRPVAVRLIDADEATAIQAEVEPLLGMGHPGIATVREQVWLPDGRLAVISDFVDGPALATARAARRGFCAAECHQLAVELLAGLARLHAAGHSHGDVSPGNIILAPSKSPTTPSRAEQTRHTDTTQVQAVLVDLVHATGQELGTRGFRAPEVSAQGRIQGPADVFAAAQVCLWAAEPGARNEVGGQLVDLLAAEPQDRPSADQAATVLAEKQRTPLQMPAPETLAGATLREQASRSPTTRVRPWLRSQGGNDSGMGASGSHQGRRRTARARHRGKRRGFPLAVGAAIAACVTLVGGLAWAGTPAPEQAELGKSMAVAERSGSAPSPQDDIEAVVHELVESRDAALMAADAQALAQVTAPGSPLRQADADLLDDLIGTGTILDNYHTAIRDFEVLDRDVEQARVRIVLQQLAHQRGAESTPEHQVPAQESHCVQLLLGHTDSHWAATRAEPCPESGSGHHA